MRDEIEVEFGELERMLKGSGRSKRIRDNVKELLRYKSCPSILFCFFLSSFLVGIGFGL